MLVKVVKDTSVSDCYNVFVFDESCSMWRAKRWVFASTMWGAKRKARRQVCPKMEIFTINCKQNCHK